MRFETERLTVRNLVKSDLDQLHIMHRNPKVMLYTGDDPKTKEEDAIDLANLIAAYTLKDPTLLVWGVIRKSDNVLVGTCALIKNNDQPNGKEANEIGFRFLEEFWGNGFGNEVAKGLIQYAFYTLGLEELIGEVDELNVGSVKILERHMNFEGAYFSEKYKSNDRRYRLLKK